MFDSRVQRGSEPLHLALVPDSSHVLVRPPRSRKSPKQEYVHWELMLLISVHVTRPFTGEGKDHSQRVAILRHDMVTKQIQSRQLVGWEREGR